MEQDNRVVTKYTGSGIKGIKRAGIRDHSLGSGITLRGVDISSVFHGIRNKDDNKNL